MKQVIILQNGKKLNEVQFLHYFEKKVLYTIRKYKLFQKIEKKEKKELKYNNFKVQDFLKLKKIKNITISKECLDDIALQVIEIFMTSTKIKNDLDKLKPIIIIGNKRIIKPFYLMTKKEIELYAKLKKIKLEEKREKESPLSLWLDEFETRHLEVKNAIVNSLLKITNQA